MATMQPKRGTHAAIDETLNMPPDLEDPQACLQRAVKCEQMAMSDTAGISRAMLLDPAKRWREMATDFEHEFGARNTQPVQPNPNV